MIKKLIALGMVVFATSAVAAPPPGSCLGGCLPTALAAPTPIFPVGYQCIANWPMWPMSVSCVNQDESPLTGAANNPHPTGKKHKL